MEEDPDALPVAQVPVALPVALPVAKTQFTWGILSPSALAYMLQCTMSAKAFTAGVGGKEFKNQEQAFEEVAKQCRASKFFDLASVPITGKVCGDKVRLLLRKHATMKQSGANRSGNAAYTALDQFLDEIMKQKEEKATEAEVKSKMAAEK
mmetsp:Transcript_54488/g.124164  ORF Transcript_54488/g.124164 Transcript_54488/m.124164 type:complete len:151 (-) Transcript_54488:597-1049(-)